MGMTTPSRVENVRERRRGGSSAVAVRPSRAEKCGPLLRACAFGAQALPLVQLGVFVANLLATPAEAMTTSSTSSLTSMATTPDHADVLNSNGPPAHNSHPTDHQSTSHEAPPSASGLLLLDFLILLADVCGFCAFYCVFKSVKHQGPRGVSLQSFLGFALGRCLHSLSHFFGIHYVPEVVPLSLYALVDGIAVVMVSITALALWVASKGDSECFADDVFGRELLRKIVPTHMQNWKLVQHGGLVFCSLIVASLWSVTRCSLIISPATDDVHYAFSLCLLCSICEVIQVMSVLPQLLMLYKTRRIPALLGDFLMFQGVAKGCTLLFWVLFPSVNGWSPHNHNMATLTEFFNLLVLSDFIYFYIKSRAISRRDSTKDFVMEDAQNWV
mmetsp:Transcript_22163/g.55883  ORF Transcript_22163/g.55883 Transcript_22163/m.55883 type:complete len:386 (-) Transcript_22163:44-1201(-)